MTDEKRPHIIDQTSPGRRDRTSMDTCVTAEMAARYQELAGELGDFTVEVVAKEGEPYVVFNDGSAPVNTHVRPGDVIVRIASKPIPEIDLDIPNNKAHVRHVMPPLIDTRHGELHGS